MCKRNRIWWSLTLFMSALILPAGAGAGSYSWITVDAPSNPIPSIDTQFTGISPTSGIVLGFYYNFEFGYTNFTYNITSQSMTSLTPGGFTTYRGINDRNAIAGTNFSFQAVMATVIGGSVSPPLGTVASMPFSTDFGYGFLGINNAGLIVGQRVDASPNLQGVIYNTNTGTYVNVSANAVSQSFYNQAIGSLSGINNKGIAVGQYQDAHGYHSYSFNIFSNTSTLVADVFGPTNSRLNGINDGGVAVGYSEDSSNVFHGILYDTNTNEYVNSNFQYPNAGSAAGQGTVISGIDNKGDLVGYYYDANSDEHGFVAIVGAVVPEPSSLMLLTIGVAATFLARHNMLPSARSVCRSDTLISSPGLHRNFLRKQRGPWGQTELEFGGLGVRGPWRGPWGPGALGSDRVRIFSGAREP